MRQCNVQVKEVNHFEEKCFQGVRCNKSTTVKMLVGDRIKYPQHRAIARVRNSETYCNKVCDSFGRGFTKLP